MRKKYFKGIAACLACTMVLIGCSAGGEPVPIDEDKVNLVFDEVNSYTLDNIDFEFTYPASMSVTSEDETGVFINNSDNTETLQVVAVDNKRNATGEEFVTEMMKDNIPEVFDVYYGENWFGYYYLDNNMTTSVRYNGFILDDKCILIGYYLPTEKGSQISLVYDPIEFEIKKQFGFEKVGAEHISSNEIKENNEALNGEDNAVLNENSEEVINGENIDESEVDEVNISATQEGITTTIQSYYFSTDYIGFEKSPVLFVDFKIENGAEGKIHISNTNFSIKNNVTGEITSQEGYGETYFSLELAPGGYTEQTVMFDRPDDINQTSIIFDSSQYGIGYVVFEIPLYEK